MAASLSAYWVKFFKGAGFPQDVATKHAVVFSNNRIKPDMLPDLDKPSLKEMGITLMGDMIAILRYAKKVVEDTTCEKFLVDSEDSTDASRPKVVSKAVVKKVASKALAPTKNKVEISNPAKISKVPASINTKTSLVKKAVPATEANKKSILKRKLDETQVDYDSNEEDKWISTPQKKLKPPLETDNDNIGYKVILPKGTTLRSRQILKKAAEQKRTVFDRLGDSSVTSTTNFTEVTPTFNITGLGKDVFKRSSSVFNRLGDKDAKKDVSPVGILKNGTNNAPPQGILKNRISSIGSSNIVGKGVTKVITKKSAGTMHADHELNKKNTISNVKQLIKTTKKIKLDGNSPSSTKITKLRTTAGKLASERLNSVPAKARLGLVGSTNTKQVTFNRIATVTHLKKPDVFSRLGI